VPVPSTYRNNKLREAKWNV